jgi:hypothetical protein
MIAMLHLLGTFVAKTSRETLATERSDLGGIGIKSRFYAIERRGTA